MMMSRSRKTKRDGFLSMTRFNGLTAGMWLAMLCTMVPAVAQDASRAFDQGNYAEAAQTWLDEADDGSAEAALRLGYLYDLGLDVPADRAEAYRYYLQAAEAGLADAAFNVGVMLESGTGMPRDPMAAAVWYARAAARDHVRAQYALGILYAEGKGVPQNSDLARYWLGRVVVALPAATDRRGSLPLVDRGWSAPTPVAAARAERSGGVTAELVWTAAAGPEGSLFEVQYLSLDGNGHAKGPMKAVETEASALSLPLREPERNHLWRVVRKDPANARYTAGPWRVLERSAPAGTTVGGQVRFEIDSTDDRVMKLVERLAETLGAAGIAVAVSPVAEGPERSVVLSPSPRIWRARQSLPFSCRALGRAMRGVPALSTSVRARSWCESPSARVQPPTWMSSAPTAGDGTIPTADTASPPNMSANCAAAEASSS